MNLNILELIITNFLRVCCVKLLLQKNSDTNKLYINLLVPGNYVSVKHRCAKD